MWLGPCCRIISSASQERTTKAHHQRPFSAPVVLHIEDGHVSIERDVADDGGVTLGDAKAVRVREVTRVGVVAREHVVDVRNGYGHTVELEVEGRQAVELDSGSVWAGLAWDARGGWRRQSCCLPLVFLLAAFHSDCLS